MKILKYVCGTLLMLSGMVLVFVGVAGSWESLTGDQLMGFVLMLPTAALGVVLLWLGIRLLRGCSGKQAHAHAHEHSEQEKADRETASRIRAAQEEARRKALREAQERGRQEHQRWLEENPEWKAQFDYLQAMLQQDVLSFYDPSGKEYGYMSETRNCTGGMWMRTPPVCDLDRVIEFYRALWDARDCLSREDLAHAPYRLRARIDALTHRRLYLRLNSKKQLSALGDRKETLLERCREQDIHLILQPSQNEIIDLTDGRGYELHTEEMGLSPLTDEVIGGEVTLVPVEQTAGPRG